MRRIISAALLITALPLAAQETRFTPTIPAGGRLVLDNINGPMVITQGTGQVAEIVVTKRVIKGDGSFIKAIMEEERGLARVCTIYTNRDPDRKSCKGENSTSKRDGGYPDVEMRYDVRVPAGVTVEAENVNGAIEAKELTEAASLTTVNGRILFAGNTARHLEAVNGGIKASFARAAWDGTLKVATVNGGIELIFPASLEAEFVGETVNGGISSDFPVTIEGKFGPKSFSGRIGKGGRKLAVETVNGGITLKKG